MPFTGRQQPVPQALLPAAGADGLLPCEPGCSLLLTVTRLLICCSMQLCQGDSSPNETYGCQRQLLGHCKQEPADVCLQATA